jgi:hypothetical protein
MLNPSVQPILKKNWKKRTHRWFVTVWCQLCCGFSMSGSIVRQRFGHTGSPIFARRDVDLRDLGPLVPNKVVRRECGRNGQLMGPDP